MVKTNYLGISYYMACCEICKWTYEDQTNRRRGQQEIRKHVKKTGHTVLLEKSITTEYVLNEVK